LFQRELRLRGVLVPCTSESHGRFALPFVWSFARPNSSRPVGVPPCLASASLLRPLLTSRSVSRRHPFRRDARSPQVMVVAFPAQSPDLRRNPLVTRASQHSACSPWAVAPHIRFLFVDSRFRYRFFQRRPHGRSPFGPSSPCGSLGIFVTYCSRGLSPPSRNRCWAHRGRRVCAPGEGRRPRASGCPC
jgi:hypothetical protein